MSEYCRQGKGVVDRVIEPEVKPGASFAERDAPNGSKSGTEQGHLAEPQGPAPEHTTASAPTLEQKARRGECQASGPSAAVSSHADRPTRASHAASPMFKSKDAGQAQGMPSVGVHAVIDISSSSSSNILVTHHIFSIYPVIAIPFSCQLPNLFSASQTQAGSTVVFEKVGT